MAIMGLLYKTPSAPINISYNNVEYDKWVAQSRRRSSPPNIRTCHFHSCMKQVLLGQLINVWKWSLLSPSFPLSLSLVFVKTIIGYCASAPRAHFLRFGSYFGYCCCCLVSGLCRIPWRTALSCNYYGDHTLFMYGIYCCVFTEREPRVRVTHKCINQSEWGKTTEEEKEEKEE